MQLALALPLQQGSSLQVFVVAAVVEVRVVEPSYQWEPMISAAAVAVICCCWSFVHLQDLSLKRCAVQLTTCPLLFCASYFAEGKVLGEVVQDQASWLHYWEAGVGVGVLWVPSCPAMVVVMEEDDVLSDLPAHCCCCC